MEERMAYEGGYTAPEAEVVLFEHKVMAAGSNFIGILKDNTTITS